MHELSLVVSIVETCENLVYKEGGKAIKEITLIVGTLSGVEVDALKFAWEMGVKNSVLEKANFKIKMEKAEAKCDSCLQHYSPKTLYEPCPICGHYGSNYLKGRELKIHLIKMVRK